MTAAHPHTRISRMAIVDRRTDTRNMGTLFRLFRRSGRDYRKRAIRCPCCPPRPPTLPLLAGLRKSFPCRWATGILVASAGVDRAGSRLDDYPPEAATWKSQAELPPMVAENFIR